MKHIILTLLLLITSTSTYASQAKLHKVTVEGHDLAVWEKSAVGAKHTILLLHGRTYSSLPDFDLSTPDENLSFMDSLVERGFNVYALDARGYGATKRDASGWLTPDRAARDVVAVIGWLTERRQQTPHVYGWSYGSMVAQLVAQRHPQILKSLMLFGYPFDPTRHVVAIDFDYPNTPAAKVNTAEHAASDFIVSGSISDNAIEAYVQAALKADPIRVDFKDLHQWAELDAKKVTVPTLLLQGEFDPIAPTAIQQELFVNIDTANKWWVVLQGGDHAALLETPRIEMLDLMTLFAKKLSSE